MKINLLCEIHVRDYTEALNQQEPSWKMWFVKWMHKMPYVKKRFIDREVLNQILSTLEKTIPESIKEGFATKGVNVEVTLHLESTSEQPIFLIEDNSLEQNQIQ